MVVAVRNIHQSSYCSSCDRHFNSLETPRYITRTPASGVAFVKETEKVALNENVEESNWYTSVRPDVRLASRVHYVTCLNCNARHRNPPYDYLYTEEKTTNVIVYGALLRLMGDMFQHQHSPDHR